MNIKKSIIIFFSVFSLPLFGYNRMPQPLEDFINIVYETTASQQLIHSLYQENCTYLSENFSGKEYETYQAYNDYILGLDNYYRNQKKEAEIAFDKGISHIEKSMNFGQDAENLTLYAKLILQNSAIKPLMQYAIVMIPKIPGLTKKAINLDPTYTPAYVMRNSFLCCIPSPYGNYREGIKKMEELTGNQSLEKSKVDWYSIYSTQAYAYNHTGNKAEAIKSYQNALKIFPNCCESKNYLNQLLSSK